MSSSSGSRRGDGADVDSFDALLAEAARLSPQPAATPSRLATGARLAGGRLELGRKLGAGGMGFVYEAFDRSRGELIAVKTLAHPDPHSIYRLKQEFRGLADVLHPNVVRLHTLWCEGGLWLFTMERIDGVRFDRFVRPERAFDEARLRRAWPQLLAGVEAIHAAGKLHRDLKPSNVLVATDPAERVVVLDFGLVADPEPEGIGQTVDDDRGSGTPAYMAPEQAAHQPATAASDVYALGVMLFEALTGRLPFDGTSAHAIKQRKQLEHAPSALTLAPEAPRDLAALCERMLARDPRQRPALTELCERFPSAARTSRTPRASGAAPRDARSAPITAGQLQGRDDELATLRAALAETREGRAVVVRVRGESGIGKSALVNAFLEPLRGREHVVVLEGRCYARESLPYKAFDRVVDGLSHYLRRLTAARAAALLPRDAGYLAQIFPVLDRVEVVADLPTPPSSGQREQRRRAFDAFAELLGRLADRVTVVLHIDEAQFFDEDSALLLEHVLNAHEHGHRHVPLLLVLSERLDASDDAHASAPSESARRTPLQRVVAPLARYGRASTRTIVLEPLSLEASRALVRAELRSGTGCSACSYDAACEHHAALTSYLALGCAGHPLFAIELARTALEEHGQVQAPRTLDELVRERSEALGAHARIALERIALCTRPVPAEVLERAAGANASLGAALDALERAQLVTASDERAFACSYERVRSAVLGTLTPERTQRYHEELLDAWATSAAADPEVLFEHSAGAGLRKRAGRHAIEAAERAKHKLAFERCAALLEHAIGLVGEDEVRAQGLHERRGDALSLCGRLRAAGVAYDCARAHASTKAERISLVHRSALHRLTSGDVATGLPRLRELLAAAGLRWPRTSFGARVFSFARLLVLTIRSARGLPAQPGRGAARAAQDPERRDQLDYLLDAGGLVTPFDLDRGLDLMTRFIVRALREGAVPELAVAHAMLATFFAAIELTRPLSRVLVEQAAALARSHDKLSRRSAALSLAAFARFSHGQLHEALALGTEAEQVVAGAKRAYNFEAWNARCVQAFALTSIGRLREASVLFSESAQLAERTGDDMAALGGDSVLRHLASDDVPSALQLLARKRAVVDGIPTSGALHGLVEVESMLCALYAKQGPSMLTRSHHDRAGRPRFFDASTLLACCALQGDRRAPATHKLVRHALRRLARSAYAPSSLAMQHQLRAALQLAEGDREAALESLAHAGRAYAQANMALHAALMRYRAGTLRADGPGLRDAADAESFVREQGVARPEAWADMLAPGLSA